MTASPLNTFLADRVTWTGGNGVTQIISKSLTLKSATTYCVSAFLRLWGGQFGPKDVIRITGNVVGTNQIRLDQLNAYPKRYQNNLQMLFTTAGQNPTAYLSDPRTGALPLQVSAVNNATVTLTSSYSMTVPINSLVGGQISFSNNTSKKYVITANTLFSNNSIDITIAGVTLSSEGVTTASTAIVTNAPEQNINIEVYSESTASLDWGGIQVEENNFRTSHIFNYYDEITVRALTELVYREVPIAGLKTCGFYIDLKYWRGSGIIFDYENLKAFIDDNNKLIVQAGSISLSPETIPNQNVRFFIQVASELSSVSLYVDGVLKQKISGISDFVASDSGILKFTTEGVRAFNRVIITDSLVLDGQIQIGQVASQEVYALFDDLNVITASDISANNPSFRLAPITIPGKKAPIAKAQVQSVNINSRLVSVNTSTNSYTNFVVNSFINVIRGNTNQIILQTLLTNISGGNFTLDNVVGIQIGDYLVYGNLTDPGRCSARFPFVPIDPQTITAIDTTNNYIAVSNSVTAFIKARAFVQSPKYEDVAEVIVLGTDPTNKRLIVDNVANISIGDTISQPQSELLVQPQNYSVDFLSTVDGVMVERKYNNGITVRNINEIPADVVPIVRVVL